MKEHRSLLESGLAIWIDLDIRISKTTDAGHGSEILLPVSCVCYQNIILKTHMVESPVLLHEKNDMLDIRQ
jgi:hypothetical protein